MAVAFTHVSWWLWGGKEHEPSSTVSTTTTTTGSSLNSSMDFNLGVRESETLKFSSVKGVRMPPATRRKWNSREERRIDREYDLVLVPSDGGCLSGSESDDSDWSIGWMEPHASDFLSDDENESSFAVLVPCYGRGRKEMVDDSKNQVLSAIVDLKDGYSAESKKYMEQWISSLQNN